MAKWFITGLSLVLATVQPSRATGITDCPGYVAKNVVRTKSSVTADLTLNGAPCNLYGKDVANLTLSVQYQTGEKTLLLLSK